MSHITTVKTQLRDGVVLRRTLQEIGYHVQEGGIISGAFSQYHRSVEFIAKKNGQQIGFRQLGSPDTFYEVVGDWHGKIRVRQDSLNEIYRAYSREKVLMMARAKGYAVVQNRVNREGQVELVLRKVV